MRFDKILYRKVIVPSSRGKNGEPTVVVVTEEANGHAVFLDTPDETTLIKYVHFNKDNAIEFGVEFAKDLIRRQDEQETQ